MKRANRGDRWRTAVAYAKEIRHRLQDLEYRGDLNEKGKAYLAELDKLIQRYETGDHDKTLLRALEGLKGVKVA
jgi:CRISPR/Cas system-associated endoribonuclease Cas2